VLSSYFAAPGLVQVVDSLWGPPNAVGLVFDVNESGYYALLLTPPVDGRVAFELVEGHFDGTRTANIPQTPIAASERFGKHTLAVECNRGRSPFSWMITRSEASRTQCSNTAWLDSVFSGSAAGPRVQGNRA
jgi:hypothetical protein